MCGDWSSEVDVEQPATVAAEKNNNVVKVNSAFVAAKNLKMAIILPTGQWYAPSAVINDAWYCMLLHGIEMYCIVLHGIAWYCMVLHGIAWY